MSDLLNITSIKDAASSLLPGKVYGSEVSLGVYPPVTRILTNPKAQIVSPITVFNNTNDTLKLDIVLKAFRASNTKNGSIQYYSPKETSAEDAAFLNTVKIEDNKQEIKQINLYPKEYKTLNIVFPGPLKDRDYYFSVIFLHKGAEEKTNESLIHVATGVAGNVLVSRGSTRNSVATTTQEFQAQPLILNTPAQFNLTLNNNSDNFISVSGNVYIYDLLENRIGEIPLKPAIILGNTSRIMTGTNGAQNIAWGEKLMLGYYTAKTVIRINQTSTQTYETHFFAVPVFILLGSTLFLFVVLSILYRMLRKINFKEA